MNNLGRAFQKHSFEDLSHQSSLALQAGKMAVFEWTLESDVCIADPLLYDLFGLPPGDITGTMVLERVLPEDRDALNEAIEMTLAQDVDYDTSFRVGTSENFNWIGGRGRVVERDADGAPLRMMGVNWDMTQAKQGEERQRALTREMDHRVNNGYAIIKALVAIAADDYDCPPEFEILLRTQIHALAVAHQLAADFMLHQSTNTRALALSQVVDQTLRILPEVSLQSDLASGLAITPQSVAPLSMLLHHICMKARTDMDIRVQTRPECNSTAEITWISGEGASMSGVQQDQDFLFELTIEQLNATVKTYADTATGQHVVFTLPILNAQCDASDGVCHKGDACGQQEACGYCPDRAVAAQA